MIFKLFVSAFLAALGAYYLVCFLEIFNVIKFTAPHEKKKIVAQGQAEAEANRLKVAAGLTPQEKAEWEYKTKVGVAQALAEVALPKVVMSGSGAQGGSAMDAMGLKMIMDIADKLSK